MCNANGQAHLKKLFTTMGEPGTFEVIKRGSDALPNIKFQLKVDAVLEASKASAPTFNGGVVAAGAGAVASNRSR